MTEEREESARHVSRVMHAAEFSAAYRDGHRDQKSLHDQRNLREIEDLLALPQFRGGSDPSAETDHGSPPLTVSSQEPSTAISLEDV